MSEAELMRPDIEVGEVTITEYRKNQIVRLAECVAFLGVAGTAIAYRKKLPVWATISMVGVGVGFAVYNGYNFHKNWRQDGKLIRQAIRNKKADEKKIREELLRKDKEEETVGSEVKPNAADNEAKTSVINTPEKNGHDKKQNGNVMVENSPEPKVERVSVVSEEVKKEVVSAIITTTTESIPVSKNGEAVGQVQEQ